MSGWKVVVVAVVVAMGGAAHADFASMPSFMSNMSTYQNDFFRASNAYTAQQVRYKRLAGNGTTATPPAAPPPAKKHLPLSATDFKPAAKGHPIVDQILADNVKDAGERAKAKTAIDQAFAYFEKNGLRPNNLASSVTVVMELSMVATTGYQGDDAAEAELLANINDAIAANPAFKKMSARDLQTTSDVLWLSAALMVQFIQQGATDPKAKQAAVQMANSMFATLTGAAAAAK